MSTRALLRPVETVLAASVKPRRRPACLPAPTPLEPCFAIANCFIDDPIDAFINIEPLPIAIGIIPPTGHVVGRGRLYYQLVTSWDVSAVHDVLVHNVQHTLKAPSFSWYRSAHRGHESPRSPPHNGFESAFFYVLCTALEAIDPKLVDAVRVYTNLQIRRAPDTWDGDSPDFYAFRHYVHDMCRRDRKRPPALETWRPHRLYGLIGVVAAALWMIDRYDGETVQVLHDLVARLGHPAVHISRCSKKDS